MFIFIIIADGYLYIQSRHTLPVYSYTRSIFCPGNILTPADKASFIASYISTFSYDINNENIFEIEKGALKKVELLKNTGGTTNLIEFEFEGTNPEYVKNTGDTYVDNALSQINKNLIQLNEAQFSKNYLALVRNDMRHISSALENGTLPAEGAIKYLALLKERLETEEINKTIIKAKVINVQAAATEKNNNLSYVSKTVKSAILGLLFSLGYIFCKYCFRKAKDIGLF